MIRPALPIAHLAEANGRSTVRTSVSGFDFAFIMTTALTIVGGCFFMLELASAYSHGRDSAALKFLTEMTVWLPAMASVAGKYILLFLASIVNSALIVLLVQSLRKMDFTFNRVTSRKVSGGFRNSAARVENVRGKRTHFKTQKVTNSGVRKSSPFLLSPVFR
ncbi:hypothetical protein EI77_01666 [Prosthecobacter fusiformis]|uniref:Uncharacterized protein n=1 Tax=Prosthecobacter fusiformis TaxID=48464 RepID=A0A4R7S6K4_9BACT|nr:hypothetical protein [Prosthecobacter fusiformis]TDU73198.1 hypothetical protein EI77_01666 [Prosthecobacter fusiformis]